MCMCAQARKLTGKKRREEKRREEKRQYWEGRGRRHSGTCEEAALCEIDKDVEVVSRRAFALSKADEKLRHILWCGGVL